MKIVIGLILLSLGVSLFLLSFVTATKTDTVIDVSFVLEPGERYGPPYTNGTYHHTRVITKSALMGEVLVEGGGINFTANGFNTQHLENVFISQNYSFVIDPADDLYWFTFQNTGGTQSSIKFTLREKWINIFLLVPSFISLLLLTSTGIALSILGIRKKPTVHKALNIASDKVSQFQDCTIVIGQKAQQKSIGGIVFTAKFSSKNNIKRRLTILKQNTSRITIQILSIRR